jgi:hypothetical protein
VTPKTGQRFVEPPGFKCATFISSFSWDWSDRPTSTACEPWPSCFSLFLIRQLSKPARISLNRAGFVGGFNS